MSFHQSSLMPAVPPPHPLLRQRPMVALSAEGLAVSVLSRNATRIFVSLFDGDIETDRIALDSRCGDIHSGFIAGITAGQRYGLRADGPYDPAAGHLFDVTKLLAHPMATAFDAPFLWHPDLARRGVDTATIAPKAIAGSDGADSLAPLPPARPEFIYEIPVKAFTQLHPDIPASQRGTVAALGHPAVIAHLERLGADTVELMPLTAWIDERHLAQQGLRNAWGYNPISFFAPDPRLAPGGMADVRAAIAALHAAGIRVILDVVYNHTGESDLGGPTLSLRGLDNALYYRHHHGALVNDTGCGNTLALDRTAGVQLVMDSLRHWAAAGFDGFRYDLAPVLGRTEAGFSAEAPLLTAIGQDPALRDLIHIAEPWDIGPGGYQLGEFPAGWFEWNDHYRDDVRRYWRGDAFSTGGFATRLAGSSDRFARHHRAPAASVNYVAAHDGFTLADAVRYPEKRNHANGEGNRDGNASEISWAAAEPERDALSLLATLFLSRGTVMLTAGDEFGRSQQGNNNAYAQDNAVTWLDWSAADTGLTGAAAALAAFRKRHARFFTGGFLTGEGAPPDVEWLSPAGPAHWNGDGPLGMVLHCAGTGERLAIWFNRAAQTVTAHLSHRAGYRWILPPPLWGRSTDKDEVLVRREGDVTSCTLPARTVSVFLEQKTHASTAPDDAAIASLARAAGIEADWWEVNGTYHRITPDTGRALLVAMGLPVATAADVQDAFAALTQQRRMPVLAAGRRHDLPVSHTPHRTLYELCRPDGGTQPLVKPAGEPLLSIPALPPGLYELQPDRGGEPIPLIVSPGTCHVPPEIAAGQRCFGLAAHLYALRHRGDAGIGDFETLARFCETAAQFGGSLAGINPLHHMFPADRARVSPYQPSDRRYIDPIYIDVGVAAPPALSLPAHVDYAAVWSWKDRVLRAQHAAFQGDPGFAAFVTEGGAALRAHAAFESRGKAAGASYHMWLQWVADRQLSAAAARARTAGLSFGIYRDLAVGCAYEGGEVAADPRLFATAVSLGAPPDPFAAAGQVWNLPPYNPLELERQGFAPFTAVLRANMRHAGVLRIDHVLGLVRQFWVPRGADGSDGAYVAMPSEALIALTALESRRAACMVIGEDLGTVPEGFRERMAAAAILSYRVLWFERSGHEFLPPQSYPAFAAACLSSHDLPPFAGWQQSAPEPERYALQRAAEQAGFSSGNLCADAHSFLASTPASLVLVQADDLSGETEPLNRPGTDDTTPNWRRRLSVPVEDLAQHPAAQPIAAAMEARAAGRRPSEIEESG